MSDPTNPSGVAQREPRRLPLGLSLALVVAEARVVLLWFLVLGVVGGLVWWQVTPPAYWTRTAERATMDEQALGGIVAADGWFFVVAVVGGLLSGFVLAARRRRDPVLTVLLLTVGAGLAGLVMYLTGHLLGPGDLKAALAHANPGDEVAIPLRPSAPALYLVWPITALFAALVVLWGTNPSSTDGHDEQD